MEDIRWINLELSQEQKEWMGHMEYLRNRMFASLGIPRYLIEGKKETRWQKIKRNVRLLIWKLGEKRKRTKRL